MASTIPHIYFKDYKGLNIGVPPTLEEQERIVAVLDEAFAAIDKAKANIERNLTNARELFQSRLNDIFSNPSEDWEVKPLGEVCEFLMGRASKRLVARSRSGPRFTSRKFFTNKNYCLFGSRLA